MGCRVRRPWGACWMVAEGGEGENLSPPHSQGWGGGVGGVSRLRFPPGPHLRSSRFSRHPRLRQAPTRRFAKNRNLRGLGKRPETHDLLPFGGRWMVSEGYSPMRGGVRLRSSMGRAPISWKPGQQAPEPCIPAA